MTRVLRRLAALGPALPLAIGFLILAGISFVSVYLVDRADDDAALVAHSLEVTNKLSQVQVLIRRTESAQRGYLLTDDTSYRDTYGTESASVIPALDDLAGEIADNPAQRRHVDRLRPLASDKLAEMSESIRLRDSGNSADAIALVRTNRGRTLTGEITATVLQMQREEAGLLDQRRRDSARTNSRILAADLVGAFLIVVLAALAVLIVRRSTRDLRAAQIALADTNVGLEAAVAERTSDLSEANEEIQRFAYIVSHDLRSPLVNIMGFTTELEALRTDLFQRVESLKTHAGEAAEASGDRKDVELGQDFDEAIGFIKASIAKMDRLINAILRLSREGRRDFRPERVDMDALLESIKASLAHQADEASATITISRLPAVTSDRLALEQVFSNLVDNALKYLRRGIAGSIDIEGRATPGGLVYDVRDNGRGIDAKDRERVFELFRRSGAQDRPGEGIGLAHVRTLVRRLGGTIALTSEPGQGSTFTVTLPRQWMGERQRKAA